MWGRLEGCRDRLKFQQKYRELGSEKGNQRVGGSGCEVGDVVQQHYPSRVGQKNPPHTGGVWMSSNTYVVGRAINIIKGDPERRDIVIKLIAEAP